ncbi:retrovirus-related pol polyprotein from transposon TNT 1-94 [Tanacetum coccineum]
MDKSWMETNRISKSYVDGVVGFTDYAVHNLQKTGNINPRVNKKHIYIPCSCTKCLNHIEHKVEEVQYHLYRHGIDISYTKWTKHGEEDEPSISAPKPVNATTEFVDDMDFAYIPTDGQQKKQVLYTNNESTNMETTDKGNTYKDCIDDSNFAMSKGKYVPVCKKNNPNMYSHVPVTGCVLGLASVTTWDEIEKKIGARKTKTCADKVKGKRKVSCGS